MITPVRPLLRTALLLLPALLLAQPVHRERAGLVEFPATAFHHIDTEADWARVPGPNGTTAMKPLDTARWTRSLRYDIQFTQPGTYRLWVKARKNPEIGQWGGNDMKIFLYAADGEQLVIPGHYPFEVGLREQREFRWLDWPKNSPTDTTDLTVKQPGLHHLYIVGGAGEEWGWEFTAVRLTKDNARPPAGGEAPYVEPPASE